MMKKIAQWSPLIFHKQVSFKVLLFSWTIPFAVTLLSICLCGFLGYWSYHVYLDAKDARNRLENLVEELAKVKEDDYTKRRLQEALKKRGSKHIKTIIENFLPFESELNVLEEVKKFSAFKGFRPIQEKITELKANNAAYKMEVLSESTLHGFKETHLKLAKSVHVNETDIKHILDLIEGKQQQLYAQRAYLKKFDVKRNHLGELQETFTLDFELIELESLEE